MKSSPKTGYSFPIILSIGSNVAIMKYINIIIVHMNVDVLVKLAINAADPVEKTAAPRTPVIMVTNAINRLTVVQRYLEIIAGIVDPSFLKDLNPEKKSCVAPMNIVPKVIHKNAAGPNNAPCITPNIGPKPAIFKK